MASITPQQKWTFVSGLLLLLLFLSPILLVTPAVLGGDVRGDGHGVGNYFTWAVIDSDASLGAIMRIIPALLSAAVLASIWSQRDGLFGGLTVGLLAIGILAIVLVSWRLSDADASANLWQTYNSAKVKSADEFRAALQGYMSGALLAVVTQLGLVCGVEAKTFLEKKT